MTRQPTAAGPSAGRKRRKARNSREARDIWQIAMVRVRTNGQAQTAGSARPALRESHADKRSCRDRAQRGQRRRSRHGLFGMAKDLPWHLA